MNPHTHIHTPVDSTCDRTLVGEHARYSPLVLRGGTADESRVVDDTVLGGVSLGFQSPEESLERKTRTQCNGRASVLRMNHLLLDSTARSSQLPTTAAKKNLHTPSLRPGSAPSMPGTLLATSTSPPSKSAEHQPFHRSALPNLVQQSPSGSEEKQHARKGKIVGVGSRLDNRTEPADSRYMKKEGLSRLPG